MIVKGSQEFGYLLKLVYQSFPSSSQIDHSTLTSWSLLAMVYLKFLYPFSSPRLFFCHSLFRYVKSVNSGNLVTEPFCNPRNIGSRCPQMNSAQTDRHIIWSDMSLDPDDWRDGYKEFLEINGLDDNPNDENVQPDSKSFVSTLTFCCKVRTAVSFLFAIV